MNGDMNKAAIYSRVFTDVQKQDGASLQSSDVSKAKRLNAEKPV
jgi:hypothetical protein